MLMNSRSSPRKQPPLRTRLRAAASDAILDAAEEVASDRGLEDTSCAAIAKRAGVAVGTLYNYFPDRDGIIAALFKTRRAELVPRVLDAAKAHAHEPFEKRLRCFVKDVMAAYEERRQFLRLALDADRVMPNVKDGRSTLMTAFTESLEKIFSDAAKMGFFPEGRHAVYARMVQGSLKALTIWHLEHGRALTDDLDLVLDAFMRGLGDPE
jgi:AcrR family transcriptional regulator